LKIIRNLKTKENKAFWSQIEQSARVGQIGKELE